MKFRFVELITIEILPAEDNSDVDHCDAEIENFKNPEMFKINLVDNAYHKTYKDLRNRGE